GTRRPAPTSPTPSPPPPPRLRPPSSPPPRGPVRPPECPKPPARAPLKVYPIAAGRPRPAEALYLGGHELPRLVRLHQRLPGTVQPARGDLSLPVVRRPPRGPA